MEKAPLGTALLAIYALLGQIVLVNLLIAMMGNTYNKVNDNADLEWKFYRLELMLENSSSYWYLPPINLFTVPITLMFQYVTQDAFTASPVELPSTEINDEEQIMVGKMCVARNTVVSNDTHKIQESTLVERKLKDIDKKTDNIERKLRKKFKNIEEGIEKAIENAIEKATQKGSRKGSEKGSEKGVEKGIEQGVEQGIEEGIEEGSEQGIEQGIKGRIEKKSKFEVIERRFEGIERKFEGIDRKLDALFALLQKNVPPRNGDVTCN